MREKVFFNCIFIEIKFPMVNAIDYYERKWATMRTEHEENKKNGKNIRV